ncbi:glycosyl hydrolases family 18 domain-containing protein [Sarocladium implicatum]|nr:glycosyl hydrolases family 18 domain-containing protein [Sarocladium implicatum]
MGYYESWSTTERGCYNMLPEAVPYGMYTDIIFSFASINPTTFRATAVSRPTADYMRYISTIKLLQPDIRIWVALGGWAFNNPGLSQTTFSDLAASEANIEAFLDSLASMMREYRFDGVDIDWEYPVAEDRHGRPEDYQNIVTFMKKLRGRMSRMRKGTSMTIPATYRYLQHFDIQALEETVDWFNVMTYNMHGSWDLKNGCTGANSHTNMTEIQQGLDLLWRNGIDPAKVTMGMAFYSRSFTLTNAQACNGVGCRVASAGNPGPCSHTAGVLLHPEIADIVRERGLSPQLHEDAAVKTVSWDNQWVSFDDAETWRLKANRAKSQCITGFMVWAMSHDDNKSTNGKALNEALGRKIPEVPEIGPGPGSTPEVVSVAPSLCRWTSCFEDCPSGFKAVKRDGDDEVMFDSKNCLQRVNNLMQVEVGRGMMKWCCPSNQPQPTCTWRGHQNSGKCRPGCESDEVEVGSLRAGCSKGHQSACCKSTEVAAAYGECVWMPCADEDGDWSKQCFGNFSHFLLAAKKGSGDMGQCQGKKKRALCCPKPPPAAFDTNCRWHRRLQSADKHSCDGSCPSYHVRLALEGGKEQGEQCEWKKAFCCADPKPQESRDEGTDHGNDIYEEFKYLLQEFRQNQGA